jgi:hypothetical protein
LHESDAGGLLKARLDLHQSLRRRIPNLGINDTRHAGDYRAAAQGHQEKNMNPVRCLMLCALLIVAAPSLALPPRASN